MSTCNRSLETLSAFVDGELETAGELELRRHLDACDECRQRVATLEALKNAVARASEIRPVPHALKEALREPGLPKRRSRWMGLLVAGFALAVIAVFGIPRLWEFAGTASVAEQMINDHLRYSVISDPTEFATGDLPRLARWFSDRVGFRVVLPALADGRVLGGRLCTIKGRLAALAFYERQGRRVSVYVMPSGAIPAAERSRLQRLAGPEEKDCIENLRDCRVCLRHENGVDVVMIESGEARAPTA